MRKEKNLAQHSQGQLTRVYGVDFSGAAKAGKKIWVATGNITGEMLAIEDCYRAEVLPNSHRNRDQCLAALRNFIGTQRLCAFGLDFPFGLPRELVKEDSWEQFILSFGERYASPDEFWASCRAAAGGSERKRDTDKERKTPFSPYNLRLYRQTYFGIRDVLAPLIRDRLACVLPMQSASPSRPWIFETCPASTLKQLDLYHLSYKGGSEEKRVARVRILKRIEDTGVLLIQTSELRSRILDDQHGDALDSIVAAFAASRALRNLGNSSILSNDVYMLEGYVYV